MLDWRLKERSALRPVSRKSSDVVDGCPLSSGCSLTSLQTSYRFRRTALFRVIQWWGCLLQFREGDDDSIARVDGAVNGAEQGFHQVVRIESLRLAIEKSRVDHVANAVERGRSAFATHQHSLLRDRTLARTHPYFAFKLSSNSDKNSCDSVSPSGPQICTNWIPSWWGGMRISSSLRAASTMTGSGDSLRSGAPSVRTI